MASNRIKGITVEIGGDVTGLDKALKEVNGNIKNTQSQLKDVQRLLKLDPTNTELLKQKQDLLNQTVGETREKLDTLKEAERQVQEQFAKGEVTKEQYDALKREIISTEDKLKDLEKQAASSNAALEKIGAVADKVAEGANKVADKTKALSGAAAAGIAAIAGAGISAAASADDLNTLAKQTGISTEMLQKAQYATDLIDVSFETFTGSISKMETKLRTNEKGFNALGIATRNAKGEMLSTEDIFFNAAEALSNIENETERDIAAQELFGRTSAELAGILDDGGAALKEYGKQAEDMGLILDQETLNSLNEVNDELDKTKAQLRGTTAKASAEALRAISPVLDDVANIASNLLEKIGNLDEGTIKVTLTVLAVIAAISPIAKLVAGISTAVSGVSTALSFLAANPIVLIIAGITAVIAAIVLLIKNWDKVKEKVAPVIDFLKGKVDEFKETINTFKNGAITAWDEFVSTIDTVKTRVKEIVDRIKGFFDFELKFPDIKTPHIKVGTTLDGVGATAAKIYKAFGLAGKPTIDVEWYAKAMDNAMILNSPTIFGARGNTLLGAGEAGSEVVAGSSTLMGMIRSAVSAEINNPATIGLLERIATNTGAALSLDINNREIARVVKAVI